jgi:hypothetical protein
MRVHMANIPVKKEMTPKNRAMSSNGHEKREVRK